MCDLPKNPIFIECNTDNISDYERQLHHNGDASGHVVENMDWLGDMINFMDTNDVIDELILMGSDMYEVNIYYHYHIVNQHMDICMMFLVTLKKREYKMLKYRTSCLIMIGYCNKHCSCIFIYLNAYLLAYIFASEWLHLLGARCHILYKPTIFQARGVSITHNITRMCRFFIHCGPLEDCHIILCCNL